jgi:hypothetical protein
MYNTTNEEHAKYDDTVKNWNQRNRNNKLKQELGSHTRKTFNRLTTKHTSHIIRKVLQPET